MYTSQNTRLLSIIRSIVVRDVFSVHSYFYINDATRRGFLIDSSAEAQRILSVIAQNDWHIERILLTHGHFGCTVAAEL